MSTSPPVENSSHIFPHFTCSQSGNYRGHYQSPHTTRDTHASFSIVEIFKKILCCCWAPPIEKDENTFELQLRSVHRFLKQYRCQVIIEDCDIGLCLERPLVKKVDFLHKSIQHLDGTFESFNDEKIAKYLHSLPTSKAISQKEIGIILTQIKGELHLQDATSVTTDQIRELIALELYARGIRLHTPLEVQSYIRHSTYNHSNPKLIRLIKRIVKEAEDSSI